MNEWHLCYLSHIDKFFDHKVISKSTFWVNYTGISVTLTLYLDLLTFVL